MTIISLKCTCGQKIEYEIDEKTLEAEFQKMGVIPILISHEDHFITAYVDQQLVIRSVERVLLVKDDESSVIVRSSLTEGDIPQLVENFRKKRDPMKDFYSFLSLLLGAVKAPENLFIAGREIGKYIWKKRREPILKMGAVFQIEPQLLLKNEITPIFEKMGKVEKTRSDSNTLVIKEAISPQFIVGTAQGVLDAIQQHMNKKVNIVLEYVMSGQTVFLTLQEAEL